MSSDSKMKLTLTLGAKDSGASTAVKKLSSDVKTLNSKSKKPVRNKYGLFVPLKENSGRLPVHAHVCAFVQSRKYNAKSPAPSRHIVHWPAAAVPPSGTCSEQLRRHVTVSEN